MATGTAIDVVMPQMGVSVSEGTITRWLKREGETVQADIDNVIAYLLTFSPGY